MMEDDRSSDFIIRKMSEALKHTGKVGVIIGEMWKSVSKYILEQDDKQE